MSGGSAGEIHCDVDFNVNDTPRSICALVERLTPLFAPSLKRGHLDLSDCKYLGPDAAVIIVATVLQYQSKSRELRVTLPLAPPSLTAFCEFSALKHYVSNSPYPGEHPESVTVPIKQFAASNFSRDPDPILRLVRQHVAIDLETEDYVRVCVNEVIQNVQDHAKSPVGAIMCARFIQKSGEVRVAIADRGIGIAASLRHRYPEIRTAKQALEKVIGGGVSARSRPSNMGCGISNLCNVIVNVLRGELFIISGEGMADGAPGHAIRSRDFTAGFPGTGVFFTIPVT